jgi:hypothetical protein
MDAYRAKTKISKGGALHLKHLPFKDGEPVEVLVSSVDSAEAAWPAGYFDSTFGAIRDPSFIRHPKAVSMTESPSIEFLLSNTGEFGRVAKLNLEDRETA